MALDPPRPFRPDGSGTLEETSLLSDETLAMLEGMARSFGGDGKDAGGKEKKESDDPFAESKLKEKAAKLGEGVTFVSGEKVKKEGFSGAKAVYRFADVTKLQLQARPAGPDGGAPGGAAPARDSEIAFRFERLPNGNAQLTVELKPSKPGTNAEEKTAPAKGERPAQEADPQQVEQMKKMFRGLRFGAAVEVQGTLVKTNSAFVEGGRVTLFDVDFGAILDNEAKLKEMAKSEPKDLAEMAELLKGIPGIRINPDPEIRIEFQGK